MRDTEEKIYMYIYEKERSTEVTKERSKSLKMASPYCQLSPTQSGAEYFGHFFVTKKTSCLLSQLPISLTPLPLCFPCLIPASSLLFSAKKQRKRKEERDRTLKKKKKRIKYTDMPFCKSGM